MLKKITFTPDHDKYDAVEILDNHLTKNDLSLNFLKELYSKHEISRLVHLLALPLQSILHFENYKARDIHYILRIAEKTGIQIGTIPEWYDEAVSRSERAITMRFLHLRLTHIGWPYTSPTFSQESLTFLKERGIERVYQFLFIDPAELAVTANKLNTKILKSYEFLIDRNELENLKMTISHPDEI